MRNLESIIEDWYDRAGIAQKAHQMAADAFDRRNRWLGIPTIAFSAIVGSSIFTSIGHDVDPNLQMVVGFLSLSAVVLASLQTFMSYSERSGKHRIAAAKYGALCRELDVMRIKANNTSEQVLSEVKKVIDALALESPNPPVKIFSAAWKNWEKWKSIESKHTSKSHAA